MTLKYESELLFDLMKRDGDDAPSDVLPYESELKEKYLNQVVGAYPKLQDYRPEWLYYNLYHHIPSDFPIESVENVTSASFYNVVPYAYNSAILSGSTKYRDIDTGEFLETFEEGRNLELVSVKMPVLKTTGKNLFNINGEFITSGATYSINGDSLTVTGIWFARQVVDLKPNTTYTLSYEKAESDSGHIKTAVYTNEISNGVSQSNTNKLTFTTPPSFKDISVIFFAEQGKNTNTVTYTNIQLEEGSAATSHEPFKSNILTVNEDVTLRGIGEVQDTWDLMTGELTQRVEEFRCEVKRVTVHGTNMVGNTRFLVELINPCPTFKDVLFNNHNFIYNPKSYNYGANGEFYFNSPTEIFLTFEPSKYTADTLKTYLEENPLILIIQLETESVKTVDLRCINEQGESATFRPIEGTMHVNTSSQALPPLLDMSVPIEATTQNLMSFSNISEEE